MTMRYVDSTDGTRLAVYEEGNPDGPTVVLVHGWPDSHVLWDGVVPLLAHKFRVIRYDNRSAGASEGPKSFSKYRMADFADDFAAVLAELSPGEPVHVLGHDWGSIGFWEYLGRPGASDRIASFTSVSGPSLHHLMRYIRDGLKKPYRPKRFAHSLAQLLHLTYTLPLSIPVLAPLALRLSAGVLKAGITLGIPRDRLHHGGTFADDAARGAKIYRANALPALVHAPRDLYVDVPVQLIVNIDDPYVRPYLYDETQRWASRLWRREVRSGHWSPFSHPQVLAAAVTELAEHLDGKPADRALLRAQIGRPRKDFGDTLVSVTGAGSGIGRETALAFARDGAELVISDIDEAGLKDTAARIGALGGIAHPYVLDVSDADAVERFADEVCSTHGVPDIVVNNAGIGVAGAFLDTPAEQFDRVLDVNLGGVVNGCRAFARRLVERGTGGHIVNVASMAAYSPLKGLNAYCTSKAAVYMFSDCLRAELSSAGIGLTTICPGIINTNIVSATEMIAPSGKRAAVATRRAQLENMFDRRGYGPDKVAKAIVTAVKKDKAIRPVTPEAYLLYGTSKVLPQGMRSIARAGVV
ncbi:short-chain dehydrogenase [Mycolicibacterium aromaticivorans JS19b1 = JCM 16368]|uniref:Short-chain dehydrogenase n=1 Tax=Mycolicibacterium aromaticivorans JS19b1 = JCM 16368 TaxID=1440774 RepID=A0A064CN53_9MYCO|nr:SDR family oxidoreductase [Mycolicibacterium aromaticivorans]KDF01761.1 short-chain dehydrogenase [Mycolicibacterium aromaticivorans JS19b1 = JCM 16368]